MRVPFLPRTRPQAQPGLIRVSVFLWAIGLNILNDIWLHLKGYRLGQEPKKPIFQSSRRKAVQRSAVYILPCLVSLIVVTLQLKHYYMGRNITGDPNSGPLYLALLQVAAKTQELLIVASLATIVVHQVRADLLTGPGVPFGLLGATSLFNQVNFFWSSTFLGSLPGAWSPRDQIWDAGGAPYWLNGTYNDFWPQRADLEHYMPNTTRGKENCTSPMAYTNELCPAGGYLPLVQRISTGFFGINTMDRKNSPYTQVDLLPGGSNTLVTNLDTQMSPYTMLTMKMGVQALESSAFAVHGPSAWVAEKLGNAWWEAAVQTKYDLRTQTMRYKYYSSFMSLVNTSVPAVRVVCSLPKPADHLQTSVMFPWVPDFEPATELADPQYSGSAKPRISDAFSVEVESMPDHPYSQRLRIFRVDLVNVTGTNATTGVLIEFPWSNTTSRLITGCVLDTRWVKGFIARHSDWPPQPALHRVAENKSATYLMNDIFRPVAGSIWSRIDMTAQLFNAINFIMPNSTQAPIFRNLKFPESNNDTALEVLIMSHLNRFTSDGPENVRDISHTLATVFADALARIGSWRTPPEKPFPLKKDTWATEILKGAHGGMSHTEPPTESLNHITYFQMNQTITGYAYKASETTDYLALAVVLAHLLIALVHTIMLWSTDQSSGCWDSLPELFALSLQSTPSKKALENTATGIYSIRTFGHILRVLVSEKDNEHVELRFDKDLNGDVLVTPDVLKSYG